MFTNIYDKRCDHNLRRNYCNASFVSDVLRNDCEALPRLKTNGDRENI